MNIAEAFRAEWPKIREYPLNFVSALVLVSVLIFGLEFAFFKERLAGKDDVIQNLKDTIQNLKDQNLKEKLSSRNAPVCPDPAATRAVPLTGSATASGDGSIANTGNESTFGVVPQKETNKKPKK